MSIAKFFNKKLLFALLFFLGSFSLPLQSEFSYKAYQIPLVISGSFIAAIGIGSGVVESKINSYLTQLENKLIDEWILHNNLNCYGESKESYYENGCPLAKNQTRLNYIKNKFTKKPWLKDYKSILKVLHSAREINSTICAFAILIAGISLNTALWINDIC